MSYYRLRGFSAQVLDKPATIRVNKPMANEIHIEIKNLKEIKAAFKQAPALMTKNLDTAIRKVVFNIRAKAVSNAPAVTGRLRGSAYTTFAPLRGEIGFKAKYADFVHSGTSAYIIEPRHKKALHWGGKGGPVVKRVNHPGIKANPYLQKAVDSTQPFTDKFFKQAVEDTLDTIGKATG